MLRIAGIHWASKYGLLWRVKTLLKQNPNAVNEPDKKGRSPLEYAAERGHNAVCELLLAHGANANASDLPPLFWAAEKGHASVVALLLKHGANVNAATSGSKETALHRAVFHGHYNVAKLLVEAGGNPNATDALSTSPLDYAFGQGNPFHVRPKKQEMVDLLSTSFGRKFRMNLYCSKCGSPMAESTANRRSGICKSCRREQQRSAGDYDRSKSATSGADHYIIRLQPMHSQPKGDDDRDYLIDKVLEVNGYARGNATIDFQFVSSVDEAYMYTLSRLHAEKRGLEIDDDRSRMHNISGGATGRLIAVFLKR